MGAQTKCLPARKLVEVESRPLRLQLSKWLTESGVCSKGQKSFGNCASIAGKKPDPPADRTEGDEIVPTLVEPTDLELIRRIASTGGRKYTAGNIDRQKYQRLVALGWLTEASVNISDVLYEVTDAGKAAALRND
jgi:hypothetical protein